MIHQPRTCIMNKKYKLKPGCHQFAPRSPAIHTSDNLSDEEAEWYLQKYPHVAALFESAIAEPSEQDSPNEESVKSTKTGEIQNNNDEDLFTTN